MSSFLYYSSHWVTFLVLRHPILTLAWLSSTPSKGSRREFCSHYDGTYTCTLHNLYYMYTTVTTVHTTLSMLMLKLTLTCRQIMLEAKIIVLLRSVMSQLCYRTYCYDNVLYLHTNLKEGIAVSFIHEELVEKWRMQSLSALLPELLYKPLIEKSMQYIYVHKRHCKKPNGTSFSTYNEGQYKYDVAASVAIYTSTYTHNNCRNSHACADN